MNDNELNIRETPEELQKKIERIEARIKELTEQLEAAEAAAEDDDDATPDEYNDDSSEKHNTEDDSEDFAISPKRYRSGRSTKTVRLSNRTHDLIKKLITVCNMCSQEKHLSIQQAVTTALLKFFEREYDADGKVRPFQYRRPSSVIGKNKAFKYVFLPQEVHSKLAAYCHEAGCTYSQAGETAVLLYCADLAKHVVPAVGDYVSNKCFFK